MRTGHLLIASVFFSINQSNVIVEIVQHIGLSIKKVYIIVCKFNVGIFFKNIEIIRSIYNGAVKVII